MEKRAKSIIRLLTVLVILPVCIARAHRFEMNAVDRDFTVNILFCSHTIKGIHYQPMPDTGKPLLVLVHGATYGKWMWDVPGYSWVDHFVAGLGYPVLAVDRLGYG